MAVKKDPRIDAYIAHAAPFAQPLLKHLRKLVHQGCPGVVEDIKWSMPFFTYRGRMFANFAAFKAHAAFGLHPRQALRAALARETAKAGEAMGLLGRITRRADLPADPLLLKFIRTAKQLHEAGAPPRPRTKPRPTLPEPPDLADALKRSKKAAAAWAAFAPSHRREYIEWITEARRPETREKRLLTAVAWVAEGRQRNWKYQNC